MHVTVNGVRLFFDVAGPKLVPHGPAMRERPTLIVLHGGPGFDHSGLKPEFDVFADIAQVIYLDHRANGRSDAGPQNAWTLQQWGEDVKGFCDALGIERPIVYGVSFGGYVAQAYATQFPDHPAKLILSATAARIDPALSATKFRELGGDAAGEAAHRFFTEPGLETAIAFLEHCRPLYSVTRQLDPDRGARAIENYEVMFDFFQPGGEEARMDYRAALARIQCPTLVVSAEHDPILPAPLQDELLAALPDGIGRLVRLSNCGHFLTDNWPDFERAMRAFILEEL
ncbi:MAG: alpha/beta fold hydrolase [Alphaproteobacteria bacterium]|nr:alpha/beta fold hydrolase [Alphaproteobacteria bacterium]